MRGGAGWATLALALLLGCRSTAPCRSGTVLLDIDLGATIEPATSLAVRVAGEGGHLLSSGTLTLPTGQRRGSVEVQFGGGYPGGQLVTIEVSAARAGGSLGARTLATRLEAGCSVVAIDLRGGGDGGTDRDAASDARDAGPDSPPDGRPDGLPPAPDAEPAEDAPLDTPADGASDGADGPPPPDAPPPAPDAAPDVAPGSVRRVFVTSTRHTGNLGGLTGANGICQRRADDVGLRGTYKAWLSDTLSGPAANLVHSTVPYVLVGGERVADSWTDLVDGSLQHAIDQDEAGQRVIEANACGAGGEVWSNTSAAGNSEGLGPSCNSWTGTGGNGSTGTTKQADGRWTNSGCNAGCLSDLPFYCFEQ